MTTCPFYVYFIVTFSMGSEDDAPKKPAPKPKAPPKKRALGDKPSKPAAAKKDKKGGC